MLFRVNRVWRILNLFPGIEPRDGYGVVECWYHQTRHTQTLKETDRFTGLDPRIHAHTQGGQEYGWLSWGTRGILT